MGNTAVFAHHKTGAGRTYGYFWIVFPEQTPERLYVREDDPTNDHDGQVRVSADGNNYGQPGLTPYGRQLFQLLSARTSLEDPTPRNYEIWSDNPHTRIRVQITADWQRVTPEQCEAAITYATDALGTVFGPALSIESGRYADIS